MNPPATPTATPNLSPIPAILAALQCAILDALPPHPGASEAQKAAQREGALEFLAGLHPRNPVEATIAAGIVAAYYAAMDCFRRAARGDLTMDLHLRTMGKAIALCRMINAGMRDLARRQGGVAIQPAALPASARPVPVQAVPVRPGSEQAVPAQAVPEQAVPAQAVPEQAVPAQAVKVQPLPGRPEPEMCASGQPVPEAVGPSAPSQPPVAEGRHERRRRARLERHAAAAAQRAGRRPGAAEVATQQRLLAELAAAHDAACAVTAAA